MRPKDDRRPASTAQTGRGAAVLKEQADHLRMLEQKAGRSAKGRAAADNDAPDCASEWQDGIHAAAVKQFDVIKVAVRKTLSMDAVNWLQRGKKP
jgi:hypothetical protein